MTVRNFVGLLLSCAIALVIAACAAQPAAEPVAAAPTIAQAVASPSATVVAPTAASPTPAPPASPQVASAPTAAATASPPDPNVQPTPLACDFVPPSLGELQLPALADLRWQALASGEQSARRLDGLRYAVGGLDPSPDGRWLVVALATNQAQGQSWALAALDLQGDAHWWLNQRNAYSPLEYLYTWLPDGRLLWVDDAGALRLGIGADAADLRAPVPIRELWLTGAQTVLTLPLDYGDKGLWRLDLASGTWEPVAAAVPLDEYGLRGFGHALAADGSHLVSFQFVPKEPTAPNELFTTRTWRVPAAMGAPAELAGTFETTILAGDGYIPASASLAGSPLWVHQLPLHEVGPFIDERDGQPRALADLPLTVPQDSFRNGYNLSPDGRWLAVYLHARPNDGTANPPDAVYIAPSSDLAAGTVVAGVMVESWRPDAVILRDMATDTLSIARLPLAEGATPAPLLGASRVVAPLPDGLLATGEGSPLRLLRYDLDGQLAALLDLPAEYAEVSAAAETMGRVFAGVMSAQSSDGNRCYGLVEWTVGPSGR